MRARTTHCIRGHVRTPENTKKDGSCKICVRMRETENDRKRGVKERKKKENGCCVRGHLMTEENTNNEGKCRVCTRENLAKFKKTHPQYPRYESKEKQLRSRKNRMEKITDGYIANHFYKTKIENVSPQLIDFHRQYLRLKREIKNATSNGK